MKLEQEKMQKNQIRWQCRRGMLELDLLLLKYFDAYFDKMDYTEKEIFEELLKETDPTLYAWLMGQNRPDKPQFVKLIAAIREYEG